MYHLTAHELLDLALLPPTEEAGARDHVRQCPSCNAQYQDVCGEQAFLREAFVWAGATEPSTVIAVRPRNARRWILPAAVVLLGVALGALGYRWKRRMDALEAENRHLRSATAAPPATTRPGPDSSELKTVSHLISDCRVSLLSDADGAAKIEYVGLLRQAPDLFVEVLKKYVEEASPLSADQCARLRHVVRSFYGRLWREQEADRLLPVYEKALGDILSDAQFAAYKRFLSVEGEVDRQEAVDMLTMALEEDLDLRFSEGQYLRGILLERYPPPRVPGENFWADPADRLIEDPILARELREALPPSYHLRWDAFLRKVRRIREEALEVVLNVSVRD